jgi:hypothetical protein
MKENISLLVLIWAIPKLGFAHGEDVLITIYGELFIFASLLIFLFMWKSNVKNKLLLFFIYLGACLVAWFITNDMPYRKNIATINIVQWGLPLIAFLAGFIAVKRKW